MHVQVNKRIPPAGLGLGGGASSSRMKRGSKGPETEGGLEGPLKDTGVLLSGFFPVCSHVCCGPATSTQADPLLQTLVSGERPCSGRCAGC